MPPLSEINKKKGIYSRELSHITGNNTISKRVFVCDIQKTDGEELIKIWGIDFKVTKFEESCFDGTVKFKNIYYFDSQGIVRRSLQFHSNTLGSITIERIDR